MSLYVFDFLHINLCGYNVSLKSPPKLSISSELQLLRVQVPDLALYLA